MYRAMPSEIVFRRLSFAALLAGFLSGCGGGDGYNVSGTVTFSGNPVPAGKIYFIPDGSQGNSGATGYAKIESGKYNTASEGGRGVVGGAMIVGIEGFDPNVTTSSENDTSGEVTVKALFPYYETTAELPKGNATQDFDVPAEAANRKDAPDRPMIVP